MRTQGPLASLTVVSLSLALALSSGCGNAASHGPPPAQPETKITVQRTPAHTDSPPPPPAMLPLDVDPTEHFASAESMRKLCRESLAQAQNKLSEVRLLAKAEDDALTADAVLGGLDDARLATKNAGDFSALMAVAHPDEAVRKAAEECEPLAGTFETSFYLDATVAQVVKRFDALRKAHPTPPLSKEHGRMLEHLLRDYRRNGLELPEAGQARLRELNAQITKLGQEFDSNLAGSTVTVSATPKQLEGLPPAYIEAHKPGADGKIAITTDYPDYFPVLQYAKDRAFALELSKQFDNRASDKNVALLEKLLAVREEKAKLLGYPTWADYVLEPRMAKNPKAVADLLDGLRAHVAKKGEQEFSEFRAMHVSLGGKKTDAIPPSDRTYLEDRVRKTKYGLDSKEVSEYFEVGRVKEGILAITSRMFGVTYRPASVAKWHPDVEPMEIVDAKGQVLGRFYFDLYPRPGKYKHAAVFSIRDTKRMADGKRLLPIAAIECNFPRPAPGNPALMSHSDATTFFHEFGHVLHHLLSETDTVTFSGTSVPRDFVEAPSQMLEEWAWDKSTLALFAKHYKTGKPIPDALHAKMLRARGFGRALATQRQLFLAALDQAYHTRKTPMDTTAMLAEIQVKYTPFKHVEGTHFQGTFGHLVGYDAGYYGYQWALSIAKDLLTRFGAAGLLDEKTARDYRSAILARGGSDEPAELVRAFLGRAPNDEAYKRFLVGAVSPAVRPKAPKKGR
jgi:thimet oligopeptidase